MRPLPLLLALATLGLTTPVDRAVSNKVSYDGYKVYRVSVPDASIDNLAGIELRRRRGNAGVWDVDVAVAPHEVAAFEAAQGKASTVLSHDLGADFAAESASRKDKDKDKDKDKGKGKGKGKALPDLDWFDAYHAYADHVDYWADLQAAFPKNSELITAGKSFEGRPLQGIHLWGKGGKDKKPAIFFNGNVHAREWITSKVRLPVFLSICLSVQLSKHCDEVMFEYWYAYGY